jgi:hypothetical protein
MYAAVSYGPLDHPCRDGDRRLAYPSRFRGWRPCILHWLASLFGTVILRKLDERKERKKDEAAPKPSLPPG